MQDRRILSSASEKGKIIINKCLVNGIDIDPIKLEQLLIIMHGVMLSEYHEPFFNQNVIANKAFLLIERVDKEFQRYAFGFKERFPEYMSLLDKEKNIIDEVINKYGDLDSFGLRDIKELKTLREICYSESREKGNLPNIVPNELIELVFCYYKYYSSNLHYEDKKEMVKKFIKLKKVSDVRADLQR